jgi:hypothetical protein
MQSGAQLALLYIIVADKPILSHCPIRMLVLFVIDKGELT